MLSMNVFLTTILHWTTLNANTWSSAASNHTLPWKNLSLSGEHRFSKVAWLHPPQAEGLSYPAVPSKNLPWQWSHFVRTWTIHLASKKPAVRKQSLNSSSDMHLLSAFQCISCGMQHVTDLSDWRELFDAIIVFARRPQLYTTNNVKKSASFVWVWIITIMELTNK